MRTIASSSVGPGCCQSDWQASQPNCKLFDIIVQMRPTVNPIRLFAGFQPFPIGNVTIQLCGFSSFFWRWLRQKPRVFWVTTLSLPMFHHVAWDVVVVGPNQQANKTRFFKSRIPKPQIAPSWSRKFGDTTLRTPPTAALLNLFFLKKSTGRINSTRLRIWRAFR